MYLPIHVSVLSFILLEIIVLNDREYEKQVIGDSPQKNMEDEAYIV